MSAGEVRDREAHTFLGGGAHTMKQDAGVLDLTVFIRPHKLRPFWILVKLQFPSPPAPVFFHERSLLYDPVFSLLSLCVRKCLLV